MTNPETPDPAAVMHALRQLDRHDLDTFIAYTRHLSDRAKAEDQRPLVVVFDELARLGADRRTEVTALHTAMDQAATLQDKADEEAGDDEADGRGGVITPDDPDYPKP